MGQSATKQAATNQAAAVAVGQSAVQQAAISQPSDPAAIDQPAAQQTVTNQTNRDLFSQAVTLYEAAKQYHSERVRNAIDVLTVTLSSTTLDPSSMTGSFLGQDVTVLILVTGALYYLRELTDASNRENHRGLVSIIKTLTEKTAADSAIIAHQTLGNDFFDHLQRVKTDLPEEYYDILWHVMTTCTLPSDKITAIIDVCLPSINNKNSITLINYLVLTYPGVFQAMLTTKQNNWLGSHFDLKPIVIKALQANAGDQRRFTQLHQFIHNQRQQLALDGQAKGMFIGDLAKMIFDMRCFFQPRKQKFSLFAYGEGLAKIPKPRGFFVKHGLRLFNCLLGVPLLLLHPKGRLILKKRLQRMGFTDLDNPPKKHAFKNAFKQAFTHLLFYTIADITCSIIVILIGTPFYLLRGLFKPWGRKKHLVDLNKNLCLQKKVDQLAQLLFAAGQNEFNPDRHDKVKAQNLQTTYFYALKDLDFDNIIPLVRNIIKKLHRINTYKFQQANLHLPYLIQQISLFAPDTSSAFNKKVKLYKKQKKAWLKAQKNPKLTAEKKRDSRYNFNAAATKLAQHVFTLGDASYSLFGSPNMIKDNGLLPDPRQCDFS